MSTSPEPLRVEFFVGQSRPLKDLRRWKRWLIRFTFFVTDWNGGLEGQLIASTEAIAQHFVKGKPNWFYQALPVDEPLPDGIVKFQGARYDESEIAERYKNWQPRMQAVDTHDPVGLLNVVTECLRRQTMKLRKGLLLPSPAAAVTSSDLCAVCKAAGRIYCPPEHTRATKDVEVQSRTML